MKQFTQYLVETSIAQTAIKAFKGQLKHVKTLAILSPENPMGRQLPSSENKQRCADFEKMLKEGHFAFKRVKGVYNQIEHSYIVLNVKLKDVRGWCATKNLNQESFFFCKTKYDEDNRKTGMLFTYYIKPEHGTHKAIETTDLWDNATDYSDYFTQVTRKFKFSIPLKIFEECVVEYEQFLTERSESWEKDFPVSFEESLNRIVDETTVTGQNQFLLRTKVNKEFK